QKMLRPDVRGVAPVPDDYGWPGK
ncbi:hypothetical protein MJI46_27795, partial [Salmonella enterica subsp. enterica serovar Cerro]|nr:hypothetical protein [Salmonella enterica subsp. enterica serovar Cerro]MDI5816765.1 hypothetical protein [Salmonella enterica subsp. enterica serovar Cerro]